MLFCGVCGYPRRVTGRSGLFQEVVDDQHLVAGPGRRGGPPRADAGGLERDLGRRVDGEVRFDAGSRGASARTRRTIGSRSAWLFPRTVQAGVEAVAACCEHGVPVVSRGGGTSLAGQACNAAVVIDWSKYCHGVVSVDAGAQTCVVEPGIVLDSSTSALAPHGLMFGPRPRTITARWAACFGNNSCGATAQAYGKTVDNVLRLEVLTYDGERF